MRARQAVAISAALAVTGALAAPALADSPTEPTGAVAFHQVDFKGEASGFGSGVSRTSCDVNGDQVDDMVVGDRSWVRGDFGQVGAAYVLFGSEGVTGGDVSDPATAGAVRIDGPSVKVTGGAWLGWSVSCLGDVNGDQIDDFVIGTGSLHHHDVAVVFGARDFAPIDLDNLGARGYLVTNPGALDTTTGDKAKDNFGYWVGSAGDVDGDGKADVAIGDLLAEGNGVKNSGRVWIVRGKASSTKVDVQVDTGQVLLTVDGAEEGDRLATVDAAGDVNGDGRDDLLLGSYVAAAWPGTTATGAGYVVFGGAAAAVDLSKPIGTAGFSVSGPARDKDRLGISGAAIGDIDGDGLADVVLGADGVNDLGRSGGAAVVLGSESLAPVLVDPTAAVSVFHCADGAHDLGCAGSTKVSRGYWVNGAAADSKAGFAVAGLPDANGDDVPDVVLGAYGEGARGAAYVLYSDPTRTAALDLAALTPAQGERRTPPAGTAVTYGRTVGSAGDFDANGSPDFFYGGNSNNLALVLRGALKTAVDLAVVGTPVTGQPVQVAASVRTLVPSFGQDLVDGTLAITVDGAPGAGLESVPVTDGVATFELPAGAPGDRALSAGFVPADRAGLATSRATATVKVAKLTASGRLVLGRDVVEHGGEVEAVFSTDDAISGPIAFSVDGAPVQSVELAGGRAAVTLRTLSVGEHRVRASYAGSDRIAAFTTEATLVVQKAAVDVGPVTLSKPSVGYGDAVTLAVTVPGGHGGEVSFSDGGREIATATVGHNDTAQVKVTRPTAGKHRYTARFHGSASLQAGEAAGAVLNVAKAKVRTIKVSGAAFKAGTRPRVRVVLSRLDNGAFPVGVVTVKAGGQRVKVRLVAADRGRAVVRLTKKARAAVRVSASFTPTDRANVATAKSRTVRVPVRR